LSNSYSVIIPCHNEAASIRLVLQGVKANLPQAQVIVVDDGSKDRTSDEVSKVAGVELFRSQTNLGKGRALLKGVEAAKGDYLIFIDGDGQDDPNDLPAMIRKIEEGALFVNGSKFIGKCEQGAITSINAMGNRFMSGLINLLFGAHVSDSQSGFRIISKKLVEGWSLDSVEYEIETEMLIRALKQKIAVMEIPVTRKARTGGATGFRRIRNGLRILRMILALRFLR